MPTEIRLACWKQLRAALEQPVPDDVAVERTRVTYLRGQLRQAMVCDCLDRVLQERDRREEFPA
jgi:hypothetical protein